MIIIKFSGGLGNQMFQYALYKTFEKLNKKVKANTLFFNNKSLHNGYELDKVFKIDINYASEEEAFKGIISNYVEESTDKYFSFDKNILNLENGYLKGYWQNENYFKCNRELLLNVFDFRVNDTKNMIMLKEIQSSESVSIHVRRGDYLDFNDLFIGVASLEYYKDAINKIKNKVKKPKFFIFSDDFDWVKQNLELENSIFVDLNRANNSYKDMYLMSQCKHNIIANSTFSWWGAWLNRNANQIVIRPTRFWNKNPNGESIYCDEWIKGYEVKHSKEVEQEDNLKENYRSEKNYILSDIFNKKKYSIIENLDIEDEYVNYYMFRISVIKDNKEKIKYYFEKFISMIKSEDSKNNWDLYISAIFHFGEYNFGIKNYDKSYELFNQLNSLTNGQHNKANEYLERLQDISY